MNNLMKISKRWFLTIAAFTIFFQVSCHVKQLESVTVPFIIIHYGLLF